MIEKMQVLLMEMSEFGSSLSGKLISLGSSLEKEGHDQRSRRSRRL